VKPVMPSNGADIINQTQINPRMYRMVIHDMA